MGAPVQESDDDKTSKGGPPKNARVRHTQVRDTPKDVGAAPASRAAPPWKRKRRYEVFEGDVALAELRSRLAPERIQEPVVPSSTAPTLSGVLRLTSGVAMAAT